MEPTCKTCKYFHLSPGQTTASCRRYPPNSDFLMVQSRIGSPQQIQRSYWPVIKETEYCGEHQPYVSVGAQ